MKMSERFFRYFFEKLPFSRSAESPQCSILPMPPSVFFPCSFLLWPEGAISERRDELSGVSKVVSEPDGKILNETRSQKAHAQQNGLPPRRVGSSAQQF